ncbi:MAG: hypothetical protein CMC96_13130 [Flavobacteriales bacterium]|nr:hypothetical protein [Flavobacteriales bacterium]|tara:strand:- start:1534 stop:2118 length:585 start_codon:yes stop_codon:yes gene_type:complete
MKKLIKGALFLAIVGTVIVGCEKEDSPIPTNNQTNNTDSKLKSTYDKCSLCTDPLAISFTNLGNYLNQQDDISDGALISYMNNNPDFTLAELESLGYITATTVQAEFDNIYSEVTSREDEEIEEIIDHVGNSVGFFVTENIDEDTKNLGIDGSIDPGSGDRRNPDGFVIFRWRGLLSKGPNCFQTCVWEWGNGC